MTTAGERADRRSYLSAEERRDQIVEATLAILVEEGVQGWTTSALADRVGVSEATLFKHFGSKDEILAEAVRRQAEGLWARIADHRLDGEGWERVRGLALDVLAYLEEADGGPLLVLLGQAGRVLPETFEEMERTRRRFHARLGEVVAEAVGPAAGEPRVAADLVMAVVQSAALRWMISGRSLDLEALAGPMLDAVGEAVGQA